MKKKLLLIFLAFPVCLFAQNLESGVVKSEVYAGSPVRYIIKTNNFQLDHYPELDFGPQFQSEFLGVSYSTSIVSVNGKSSQNIAYIYTWKLVCNKSGEYSIPSFSITSGDQEYKTMPTRLTVVEPQQVENVEFTVTAEQLEAYPHEPVLLSTTLLVPRSLTDRRFRRMLDNRENILFLPVADNNLNHRNATDIVLDNERLYAKATFTALRKKVVFHEALIPLNEDTPIDLSYQVHLQQGVFDTDTIVVPSNTVSLRIKPLPEAVNDLSSGLLLTDGTFEAEMSLDRNQLYAGDQVEVTLVFRNLVNYPVYKMSGDFFRSLFRENVTVSNIETDGEFFKGEMSWKAIIQPESSEVFSDTVLTLLNVHTDQLEPYTIKTPQVEILSRENSAVFQGLDTETDPETIRSREPVFFFDKELLEKPQTDSLWLRLIQIALFLIPLAFLLIRFLPIVYRRLETIIKTDQRYDRRWSAVKNENNQGKILNFLKDFLESNALKDSPRKQKWKNRFDQIYYGGKSLSAEEWDTLIEDISRLIDGVDS